MKINWFKNILKLIISKSFLGSVAFAFALWFYTTLNSEFVTIVKIPFSVILPAHKALETQLPSIISVEVRGTGWKLFNLLFFNTAARCQLDLSLEKLSNISFQAHRNDIIKSLQYMSNVEALDVWPQNLDIETGSIGEFSVLVEPDIKIIPRDGFTLVGKISIKPDLINIKGNLKIVSNINSWKTQKTEIYDSYLPVSQIVPLSDSLKNVVELSHSQVRVIADIQHIAEMKVFDIKVHYDSKELQMNHKIFPDKISIIIRGGINELAALDLEKITAKISIADILKDSTGIIIPEVNVPENIKILSMDPPYLKHLILVNNFR